MNAVTKAYHRAVIGLKNAALRWSGGARNWWNVQLGGTTLNYAAAVGDGSTNAAVQACLKWIGRTFLEAPPRIRRYAGNDKLTPEPRHPLILLMRRPNPYYSGRDLWRAMLNDLKVDGNGYWYKVKSGAGIPVQLYWLPTWMVTPRRNDGSLDLVSYYDYTVDGIVQPLKREDVVHFRGQLDPKNPMRGLGEIASLLREIYTDDEAANYTASLLRNMGVAGPIIRPKTPEDLLTPDQAAAIKAQFQNNFTGDNRGMAMVGMVPLDIDRVGYNPAEMQLRELRRIPEERISAVLGVPAMLAGLGAGLDRSTLNNYPAAREAGFETCILPTQADLAETIMTHLVPDFDDPDAVEFDFDISGVRVLQDDQTALATRMAALVHGTIRTIDEARQEMGDEPLPDGKGDALVVPNTVTIIPVAEIGMKPEPVASPIPAAIPPNEPTPLPVGQPIEGAMAAD